MKRALSILIASIALAGITGCACFDQQGGFFGAVLGTHGRGCQTGACAGGACPAPGAACSQYGGNGYGDGGAACARQALPPSAATVAYPYYTVHGPRDYFAKNTPSIGP